MTADPVANLLDDLQRRGIELQAAGDKLRYRPVDAVAAELRERLARHKAELLERLRADADTTDWSADARAVISQFTDPRLRSELTAFYDKAVATLEHEAGLSRHDAQMQGFGLLLYDILRRGMDVKAATRPLATGKRGESDGSKP